MTHGDGTYTVDRFEPGGGNWTTTPYSDIELYLMGLVGPGDVDPIPVFVDPEIIASDAATVTVEAQFHTVSIADIVAKHGERIPAVASAQKAFEAAFVIVSGSVS